VTNREALLLAVLALAWARHYRATALQRAAESIFDLGD
jgi:hypothetical protein